MPPSPSRWRPTTPSSRPRRRPTAACSCPAGDQDPKAFAADAQALLPSLQGQERQLEGILPAASVDIAAAMQAVIDVNRQLQADVATLDQHKDDADTRDLVKAHADLLKHLAAPDNAIQVVHTALGGTAPAQSTPSSAP